MTKSFGQRTNIIYCLRSAGRQMALNHQLFSLGSLESRRKETLLAVPANRAEDEEEQEEMRRQWTSRSSVKTGACRSKNKNERLESSSDSLGVVRLGGRRKKRKGGRRQEEERQWLIKQTEKEEEEEEEEN